MSRFLKKLNILQQAAETARLRRWPRFTTTETNLLSKRIQIVDSTSFLFMYNEIFDKEIYKFAADSATPTILDCGSNIGLSIIYFKKLYPASIITGFEPAPDVFPVLQHNIKTYGFSNVKLIQKAISDREDSVSFWEEGADGGRIVTEAAQTKKVMSVQATRLKNHLDKPVDLLKIDIEGEETAVLQDCHDRLRQVKNLFVEYHSFIHQKQTLHRILEILSESGFRYYIHHVGVFSKQPFFKIESCSDMDLQLNIYACKKQ